jgi:competence protein ComEA
MVRAKDNSSGNLAPSGELLSRLDQAAIAVILTVSLAAILWSLFSRGYHHGGLIDIEQAETIEIEFLVDINSADWPELTLLPNIGEVLAQRIIEYRQQQGPFTDHEQLQQVAGIGPRTLEAIRPYLAPLNEPMQRPDP